MYRIYTTEVFDDWFTKLKDQQAKRRIQVRIDRVEDGKLGDMNRSVKVFLNYVSSLAHREQDAPDKNKKRQQRRMQVRTGVIPNASNM